MVIVLIAGAVVEEPQRQHAADRPIRPTTSEGRTIFEGVYGAAVKGIISRSVTRMAEERTATLRPVTRNLVERIALPKLLVPMRWSVGLPLMNDGNAEPEVRLAPYGL